MCALLILFCSSEHAADVRGCREWRFVFGLTADMHKLPCGPCARRMGGGI